jgi:hypothetical protein
MREHIYRRNFYDQHLLLALPATRNVRIQTACLQRVPDFATPRLNEQALAGNEVPILSTVLRSASHLPALVGK